MKLEKNIFSLSKEQEENSKFIYEGKVIKCLVAPYHTYSQLEKEIPFTKNTYLLPERDLTIPQLKGLISMIVKSPSKEEFRIVTVNQNVIIDMIDDCVRVLTEDGKIVPCPTKTFMANIHDIRYKLLENPDHKKSKETETAAHTKITALMEKINKVKTFNKKQRDSLFKEIDVIGEEVISYKLKEMVEDKFAG